MARPREFDETTVLEAAMNCFWAQGFEQTSVRDLAERMGITGASLYNAFGDKRSLYRQAFVHYLTQTVRDRVARLEKLPSALAIRIFFDEIIERSVDDEQRRIAIVSSAGLVLRGEDPFRGRDPHYHAIPATTRPADLLCSHISINFDRTGLQEDWNVAFPVDRLRELAAQGTIRSMADTHYSFMGATDPLEIEPYARELAGRLKQDSVDSVLLAPV